MTRPARVAIVSRSVFPIHGQGGLERSVYDLARHLADADVGVTLITRTPRAEVDPAGIHPRVAMRYVPYRSFPFAGHRGTTIVDRSTAYPLFGLRAGAVAADLVSRGEADVVHGFGASVLGYARRRHALPAPLVLNPQGLEEFGATDPSRAPLKRLAYLPLRRAVLYCAQRADAVIATDRSLEPAVKSHLRVPDAKIWTIPNAIDLQELDARAGIDDGMRVRREAGVADEEIVLLSVGRLEENKGFHVLAAALAALKAHSGRLAQERWRWVIVGAGPFRSRLERVVADAGLARSVHLVGRLGDRDLHGWYEAADLFVHPTLYEGSSLVTLEAMAHRRACVVTRAGGLPDKVKNGVNGWIVEPGDPSALAAAISGAIDDRLALMQMGAAGRQIVEREFSWAAAVQATLELYDELLDRGRPSS
ncbi:MAG TPA: glycosyltransferase family 4 protein [Vicinamibacterales bacterium]|nr:glycosyltransferase family 4 protein [Vicinamibacterales bacterium]